MEKFLKILEGKMKESAEDLRFEQAAYYRNPTDMMKTVPGFLKTGELFSENDYVFSYDLPKGRKMFYIKKGSVIRKEFFDDLHGFIEENRGKKIPSAQNKFLKFHRDIVYRESLKLRNENKYGVESEIFE